MGSLPRPGQTPIRQEAYALEVDQRPVSIAVSASIVSVRVKGFSRTEVVELVRLCTDPGHRWATRVMLRLCREIIAPRWSCWPVRAAVAYSQTRYHDGAIYRFDGWRLLAELWRCLRRLMGCTVARQPMRGDVGPFWRTGPCGAKRHAYGSTKRTGLKPKDLMMMPARVAMAVQADGWWVRSDNIFAKENPQPESVTDRPTRAHEYVFLLTKSGSSTYWTHRDGPGTRVKPPPDYRYQNAETGEEVVDPPDGWDAPDRLGAASIYGAGMTTSTTRWDSGFRSPAELTHAVRTANGNLPRDPIRWTGGRAHGKSRPDGTPSSGATAPSTRTVDRGRASSAAIHVVMLGSTTAGTP